MDQVLPFRAIPEIARCPPGSILFTFVLQSTFLSSNCIHCSSIVDVFCTLDIYCMSVRPGRGIPLLFFFPLKGFFGKFLLIQVEGLRTEGVVQIVKSLEANCDL